MKNIIIGLLILVMLNSCAQEKKENFKVDYLFTNVSIIPMDKETVLENKSIAIKDGKIIDITDSNSKEYKSVEHTIDVKGRYIMPTLSDAHVHLPKDESKLEKLLTLHLINGVTKIRSMRGNWKHVNWKKEYNTANSIYPKMYLSSPPINRKHNFEINQLTEFVDNIKSKGFSFIKILSIKDETLFKSLDSICKINNIAFGGHFPKNISDETLFKSNYTSFEHLGGLVGKPELLENRLKNIKEKNIFICPTLSWYSVGSGRYSYEELRNQAGMKFIPKSTIDNWINKTKQYRDKLGEQAYKNEVVSELKTLDEKYEVIKKLNKLDVKMLLSPDSSSKYMVAGFGMVGEMELLKNADLSNYDILKMATVNFSYFFKENYGTIQVGKDADFLILNENPLTNLKTLKNIDAVFFNTNYIDNNKLKELTKSILPN
ncbi:MAG: amidohydrolase family protein [Flavobacteriaceae bacterium]|nr:amidohydrolase family protein [Flavobacteriaceae bacterium]